jgi:hypothetical protein
MRDSGSTIFYLIVAAALGVRYAVIRKAGRFPARRLRWRERDGDDPARWVERDDEPERFRFWQRVNLAACILFLAFAALCLL